MSAAALALGIKPHDHHCVLPKMRRVMMESQGWPKRPEMLLLGPDAWPDFADHVRTYEEANGRECREVHLAMFMGAPVAMSPHVTGVVPVPSREGA
jgi:hypothetical protein